MLKLSECPIPVHGIVILLMLSVTETGGAAQSQFTQVPSVWKPWMGIFLSAWELRVSEEQNLRDSQQFVGVAEIAPTCHTGQLSIAAIIR